MRIASVLAIVAVAIPAIALAVPGQITTSGRVLDSSGVPINQTLAVRFDLTDEGVSMWDESHTVIFEDGYYAVILGTTNPITPAHLTHDLTLDMRVGTSVLSSQPLTSAPYARAVDGLVRVGAVTSPCTPELSGTLSVENATLSLCTGTAWQALAQLNPADGTSAHPSTSCRQVYEDGHSTGNGKYWLLDNNDVPFPAYCDMENGGWTLMAVDRLGGYSQTSEFWNGALGSSTPFTWGEEAFTTGDLEAVIRSVPFEQLRLGEPSQFWWIARFADGESTFSSKKARQTPALFDKNAPYGCGWNRAYTGSNTTAYTLFGCESVTGYGDRDVVGLGTLASRSSGGASCYVLCETWHTFGRAGHRSFAYISADSSGAWVR